jgi:hypothetical protein
MDERIADLERCLDVLVDQRREEAADHNQPGVASTQLQIEAVQRAIEDERHRPDPATPEETAAMARLVAKRVPPTMV